MNTKTKDKSDDTDDAQDVSDPDNNYVEGQPFGFDDVPMYCRVYYMGRLGWIIEKGEDVRKDASGRHVKIQYKEEYAGRKHSNVHEKLVNKFLRKKEKLWVDFDHQFTEYA